MKSAICVYSHAQMKADLCSCTEAAAFGYSYFYFTPVYEFILCMRAANRVFVLMDCKDYKSLLVADVKSYNCHSL